MAFSRLQNSNYSSTVISIGFWYLFLSSCLFVCDSDSNSTRSNIRGLGTQLTNNFIPRTGTVAKNQSNFNKPKLHAPTLKQLILRHTRNGSNEGLLFVPAINKPSSVFLNLIPSFPNTNSSSTVFSNYSRNQSRLSNITQTFHNNGNNRNRTITNSGGSNSPISTYSDTNFTFNNGNRNRSKSVMLKYRRRRNANKNAEMRSSKSTRKTLTILGLFELSYNNTVKRESGEIERAAAQLALDDINGNDQILPGYQLAMHTNDTQCDPGAGVDAFFHALYRRKNSKVISLLGTACSEVTERLAKVATHQRIIQVSFGSTSPSLSDRKEFPLFYRTVAPVSSHAEAIIELIRYFNWDTVSFFTENENRFTMPVNHLVKELEEKGNITCTTITFSLSDFRDQLQAMKDLDSRIIIASFGAYVAPLVFCEVSKLEMFGPDFAWIWIGKPESNWWKDGSAFTNKTRSRTLRKHQHEHKYSSNSSSSQISMLDSSSDNNTSNSSHFHSGTLQMVGNHDGKAVIKPECGLKELTLAIENTLVVDRHNVLNSVSDFGLTTEAFRERLRVVKATKTKGFERALSHQQSQFAPETYDAVWTVALGLKQLHQKYNYSLENFNYMDDEFSHAFNEEIGRLKFTGVSGPITFSGSDRIGITSFMQVQGGSLKEVGLFHPDRLENKLELSTCVDCHSVQWPGNQVPIARREVRIKPIRVEGSLYIIVACVALLGILLAAAFLAFNLYYRKLKYIKLSSPRLNNMVIIGCIFAYVAVIILGSDFGPAAGSDGNRLSYICTTRAYLLSMAFSLAFGAMFAKTYRVHRIFTRSCIGVVKNKLLKDTQLMTLIMALLLIDVIIVTSWAVVDPMHRHLRNLTLEMDPSDRSVGYQLQIEVCRSAHEHVWLSVMYGYKSLLLVVGIYMAWETRHVKIQALNDSKNIAYCVYIVVLTSVLAVSLANLISERVTLSFVSVTSLILTSTTVTLCLLFLPKIHAIKTGGDKGDPVVESMGLKIEFNTRRLVVEDAKELLFRAEVQNRVYKRQIEAIDVEIWRLENLLLCSSHSSLTSLGVKKQNQDQNSVGSLPTKEAGGGESSPEESSEIYTVYLHGPRFIVPISVLNFQNPNALVLPQPQQQQSQTTKTTDKDTKNFLSPTSTTSGPPPRSSWPNVRSLLAPSNGITKNYRFKSEPKLCINIEELVTSDDNESSLILNPGMLSSPKVTFGESDESFLGSNLSKTSPNTAKSSRKSSNTSCGGVSKKSSFLALLKHPLAYFSGIIRSGSSPGGGNSDPNNSEQMGLDLDTDFNNEDNDNTQIFHLNVPKDSFRQKFSSVPDLWAVRTSPILHPYPKKSSILSDSVVDTSSFRFLSEHKPQGLSSSNPVLKLTMTSDESPYL